MRTLPQFPGKTVSGTYDLARRIITVGLDATWKHAAIQGRTDRNSRHVDIGTGTGSMLAAGDTTCIQIGIDHEVAMLHRARRTRIPAHWVAGDIRSLPLRPHSVDLVTAAYVVRYAENPVDMLQSIRQILRPGGTLLIYEVTLPPSPLVRLFLVTYLTLATTLIGLIFHFSPTRYWHLWRSIHGFNLGSFLDLLHAEGFPSTQVERSAGGAIVWIAARLAT